MAASSPLVVAIDDGYASYDQEEQLLAAEGARFALRPVRGDADRAVEAVRDASIVFVRESPVPRRAIEAMAEGRAVIRYGIGVDNIDQRAARERRIYVANVPDYGTDEVSSQAVALVLAVNRLVVLHDREVRAGRWSTGVLRPMLRLRGRTLGLVGYGRIAKHDAREARRLRLRPRPGARPAARRCRAAWRAVDLDTLCREADVISLHAPLNDATRGMIDARRHRR